MKRGGIERKRMVRVMEDEMKKRRRKMEKENIGECKLRRSYREGKYITYREGKYITYGKIKMEKVPHNIGSFIVFYGIVRGDRVNGKSVKAIFYDCYVDMAEKEIEKIEKEAMEKFGINKVYIKHRIGKVMVGEVALFVGVLSEHRKEGFSAIQYIIDEVKKRVPIWKKEIFDSGERWVDGIVEDTIDD